MRQLLFAFIAGLMLALPAAASEGSATMLVSTEVRYEPLNDAKILDSIAKGTEVEILQCVPSGTWCKIRFPGEDGWVKAETFDHKTRIHTQLCTPDSKWLLCTLR